VIDRNRANGKEDCVAVVRYQGFRLNIVRPELRRGLTLIGKLKGPTLQMASIVLNADACHCMADYVWPPAGKAINARPRTG